MQGWGISELLTKIPGFDYVAGVRGHVGSSCKVAWHSGHSESDAPADTASGANGSSESAFTVRPAKPQAGLGLLAALHVIPGSESDPTVTHLHTNAGVALQVLRVPDPAYSGLHTHACPAASAVPNPAGGGLVFQNYDASQYCYYPSHNAPVSASHGSVGSYLH